MAALKLNKVCLMQCMQHYCMQEHVGKKIMHACKKARKKLVLMHTSLICWLM